MNTTPHPSSPTTTTSLTSTLPYKITSCQLLTGLHPSPKKQPFSLEPPKTLPLKNAPWGRIPDLAESWDPERRCDAFEDPLSLSCRPGSSLPVISSKGPI